MYSKLIIDKIIDDWVKGASAQETQHHIQNTYNKKPSLTTIYKYRDKQTAEQRAEELLKHQLRSITKAEPDDLKLAMHYRNELLKLFYGTKIMSYHKEEIDIKSKHEEKLNVTLEDYRDSVQRVVDRYIQQNNPT